MNHTYPKLIIFVLSAIVCHVAAQGMIHITDVSCNHQKGAMALVDSDVRVGWKMVADSNENRQTAYQIVVSERVTCKQIYDSQKIISDNSQLVLLPRLPYNKYGYSWKVRVWDRNDAISQWSREQDVRIMPDSIEGHWIGAITRRQARIPDGRWANTVFKKDTFQVKWKEVDTLSARSIILGKDFMTKRNISDAVMYITGMGHYELQINGNKVGDAEFAPLWSEYSKTVYYNVLDVKQHLQSTSRNRIEVLLGNGFFNVQALGRYSKLQTSFGPPQMLCMLKITYADGSVQTIMSDETWQWCLSPITFNSIYGGESYDATMEGQEEWHDVCLTEGPAGKLTVQTAPPVKVMERYPVKSWHYLPLSAMADVAKEMKRTSIHPTTFVADMRQNLAGFPEISISGKRGQKVIIYVGERLTEHGAVAQRETGRPHYYEYTLRGDGIDLWHPRFSYYGFQYIQVEGAVMQGEPNPDGLPVIYSLNSCFVYNSAEEVSTFRCGSTLFTDTHRLIERAERSNMQAVLSDCPHREKLGWLEQDHLNGPSLLYNYDMTTYLPKILRDITDTQKDNGMVPTTAPQYVSFGNLFDDSPEWGSALAILPFMYYDHYGDSTLIVNNYVAMKRYVDYLTSRAKDGILDFGLGDWYDYGPWKSGFSRNTPVSLVATAHYIYDLQLIQRAAQMVGEYGDASHYATLCEDVVTRFNQNFYKPDSCIYGSGSQTSLALPIFLGITGDRHDAVLQKLIEEIAAHGNRLTTGDVGNRYLIQTLAREGMDSLVYKMFNHNEAPGYGFVMQQGATTLTEQWDPRNGTSWNHFMMGQLDEWLFKSMAGIWQKDNTYGMRHLVIAPHLWGDVKSVMATIETLYGKVAVARSELGMVVSIPVGCDADITAPDGTVHHVGSGVWNY